MKHFKFQSSSWRTNLPVSTRLGEAGKSQDGITLVVALVLLSAVGLASFTLSSIVLRDVKGAALIQDSAPAINGAYAGGEVGLYRLQRNLGIDMTDQLLSSSGAKFDVVGDLTDDPLLVHVVDSAISEINLYDADDVEVTDPGIRRVVITNVSGKPLKVSMFSWGAADVEVCGTGNLPAGSSQDCPGLIGPDFRYKITLDVNGSGSTDISIRAFDAALNPIGLPSPNPSFDATGKLGQVNHKIRVNLSN